MFTAGVSGHAGAASAQSSTSLADAYRDFPAARTGLCLDAANRHPMTAATVAALNQYLQWRSEGAGGPDNFYGKPQQLETRTLFARLIGAAPDEIALVNSTTEGENVVAAGLGLHRASGNVVIDELGWGGSRYLYRMLERGGGPSVRVVRHRNWSIAVADMDSAIDRATKLVSLALVSNINGAVHDVRAVADLAHARGAYLYADIIQAAGAIPIDVHEANIDFAACNTSKWLMGDYGFGFLYVRRELQDRILKPTRFGTSQILKRTGDGAELELVPGAARFDTCGSLACGPGVCAHAALQYINRVGVANIQHYVQPLVEQLQKELPTLGYRSLTPRGTESPIVSFEAPDLDKALTRLRKVFGIEPVTTGRWEFTGRSGTGYIVRGIRIAPSVYNTSRDIDRLLNALN
jgi:selenocysteine lyase/cysteine desulfurase